jgi:hypothetical protein
MNREEKIAESLIAAGQVFDMTTVDDWVNKLQSGIKAPTVGVKYSTLGGEKDVSILIMVSMDDKKDWINNILENSHYVRLHLYNDGVLDMISGHVKPAKNFRKTRVMSVEDAIMKINRYVVEVDRARDENKTGRTGMRNEVVAEELAKIAKSLMAVPMTFDAPSTETTRWAKKTLMITLNVDASWKQIYASLLTVQEWTSNKFHYFGIFKSRDGECVGGNAYGRIGYNPKAIEIARGGSSALVMNAVLQKVSQKRAKGYQVTEV